MKRIVADLQAEVLAQHVQQLREHAQQLKTANAVAQGLSDLQAEKMHDHAEQAAADSAMVRALKQALMDQRASHKHALQQREAEARVATDA